MTGPAYPAARAVAAKVQPHFARDLSKAERSGHQPLAPLPDVVVMESMIDAAFWASLRREEGYSPKISLAYVPPDLAGTALRFQHPLPLATTSLVPLAPAVERPGIHLGVWREKDELQVWGATRTIPALCFVLEVVAPGLLVIKTRRLEESAKFINVAVLEGDQVKVVDLNAAGLPGCPAVMASLLGVAGPSVPPEFVNVHMQLAISMRAHGRGGTLLVVPPGDLWRESIVRPIRYSVSPAFAKLNSLLRQQEPEQRGQRRWQDGLRRVIDAIGGLTAVDGATILNDEHELLAFGAKIRRREGWPEVERVVVTEPIEGAVPQIVAPAQLGGTRHLSAAQFAHDQRTSVAMVASQDGRFTLFAWSPGEDMVHAHRVESLLL